MNILIWIIDYILIGIVVVICDCIYHSNKEYQDDQERYEFNESNNLDSDKETLHIAVEISKLVAKLISKDNFVLVLFTVMVVLSWPFVLVSDIYKICFKKKNSE